MLTNILAFIVGLFNLIVDTTAKIVLYGVLAVLLLIASLSFMFAGFIWLLDN